MLRPTSPRYNHGRERKATHFRGGGPVSGGGPGTGDALARGGCPRHHERKTNTLTRRLRCPAHGFSGGPARRGTRMDANQELPRRSFAFGLERLGLVGLALPRLTLALIV